MTACCLTLGLFDSWSQYLLPITTNRKIVGHGVWQKTCVRSELAISHDVALHAESCKTRSLEMRIIANHAFEYFQKNTTKESTEIVLQNEL